MKCSCEEASADLLHALTTHRCEQQWLLVLDASFHACSCDCLPLTRYHCAFFAVPPAEHAGAAVTQGH
jgi:hypothetical protein